MSLLRPTSWAERGTAARGMDGESYYTKYEDIAPVH